MVFWSFSFIWYKQVFLYYGPISVVVMRLVIALPLLFTISVISGKLQIPQRKHITWFLLLGFFEPFLYFVGESFGVRLITPTLASVMISMIPLLAPVPARLLFRERLTMANYTGILVSVSGVVVVIFGEGDIKQVSFLGILLMLMAVFSAIFHSVYVRKLAEHYNPFTIVTYQSGIGLLYFLPWFAVDEMPAFIRMSHTWSMWQPVIKLAVFASSFAFLLFVYSIRRIGMAKTTVFINLIPVFTAFLAYLLLNETFGWLKIAGIATVIAGLVLSQVNRLLWKSPNQ
jgi:drug/metabolite transporter (DMT)-like permease